MEAWILVVIAVCFAIVVVAIMIFRESSTCTSTEYLEGGFRRSPGYLQSNVLESTVYPQLDLHNYKAKEAMEVFITFLSSSARDYKNSNYIWNKRYCVVITGRGKHSPDGVPVIKPAVDDYLKKQNYYTYSWRDEGSVVIDLLPSRKRVGSD